MGVDYYVTHQIYYHIQTCNFFYKIAIGFRNFSLFPQLPFNFRILLRMPLVDTLKIFGGT